MYSDSHWFSDTVLAAAIGYFIGKAVVKFDDDSNNNISFTPYLIPNGAGVSFSYSL
jgi:hypothetical protein